ncbi:MAG: LrgB family protein [Lachnospiraceae bacterium]|nr:LrgB family protein [Lachnospiraceae bacterium]
MTEIVTEALTESVYFGIALTLLTYQAGLWIKKKVKLTVANPLLLSVIMIISILLAFEIDYDVYHNGAKYISFFLTPTTVCLAVPLYRQLDLLKKYPKAIFGAITAGVFTAMVSIYLMSLAFGLTHEQYVTLLPKSITTAIGMGISEKMGGIVTITVVSISITGILGNIVAESLCKICKIQDPIAKGLAIGTGSHALGTTKAMEMGEIEGAMSSLSIVVAGIMTVVAVSIFANFI